MTDEKPPNDVHDVGGVDSKHDRERSNYADGKDEAQDMPGYGESESVTQQKDAATRQPNKSPNPLNNHSAGFPPAVPEKAGNQPFKDPTKQSTIADFYKAIKEGNNELIRRLLEIKTVTTETVNRQGQTPLLAAIDAGHISTVHLLLEAGADPNAYGAVGKVTAMGYTLGPEIYRTPLQFAAARGDLPVVRLLMETYGADDALVAPDGEVAVRLASANGHREIVDYLPARRAGGLRRWKARNDLAMRRGKNAAKRLGAAVSLALRLPRLMVRLPRC